MSGGFVGVGLGGVEGLGGGFCAPFLNWRTRFMNFVQFQCLPGSVWWFAPPNWPGWFGSGTSLCPMMCLRSTGNLYFTESHATSRAKERYCASVVSALAAKPDCSMPIERSFTFQLPACHAMFLSATLR